MLAVTSQKIVIKGDDNYPPYSFVKNHKMQGIYSDIIREVSANIEGYDIELKPIPWKRGLLELAQGGIFALYPPYYRPVARPYMDYSHAIFNEEVTIYCNDHVDNHSSKYKFPNDYYGLTIGINLGFLTSHSLTRAAAQGNLKVVPTGSTNRNLLLLLSHRIDCYVNDKNAILYSYGKIQDAHRKLKRVFPHISAGPTLSQEKGYLGITQEDQKYPYKEDFLNKFNRELQRLQNTGKIDTITKKYINLLDAQHLDAQQH